MKLTGKPNVGNPHVGFDEAGTGNGLMSTAPVLDPTDEAGVGNVAWPRCCDTRNRKSETTGNTNFDLNRRASSRPYLWRAWG